MSMVSGFPSVLNISFILDVQNVSAGIYAAAPAVAGACDVVLSKVGNPDVVPPVGLVVVDVVTGAALLMVSPHAAQSSARTIASISFIYPPGLVPTIL